MYSARSETHEDHAVDRITSEFVAVAAHELRTPMTAIKAYTSLLLAGRFGPVESEQERALEVIDRNVDRLVRFTTDLLTLSRIEAARLQLSPSEVDVLEVVSSAMAWAEDRLARAGVSSLVLAEGDSRMAADRHRLRQILENLIDNAARYAPPGSQIAARLVAGDRSISVSLSNRGGAIPEEKLPHIFEKFYQCDGVDSALHVGTGLGLAICQGLVHLMGGQIWATNHPDGLGVTFEFDLPREAPLW